MAISNNMKQCRDCKKILPKTQFYSGRRICKRCKLKQNDEYRKRTNYNKLYHEKNKEKENKRCLSNYYKWKDNPEKKLKWRENQLKQNYGIDLEDYNEMLNKQNACCAICNTQPIVGRGLLHVDHCHDTGKVRGLLCHYCNMSLGGFRDDIKILRAAIKYLKNSRQ